VNEPKDWPHIRCKLSCKIGRDALMTFSIYSLLGAGRRKPPLTGPG
jgi:hypothetical protein